MHNPLDSAKKQGTVQEAVGTGGGGDVEGGRASQTKRERKVVLVLLLLLLLLLRRGGQANGLCGWEVSRRGENAVVGRREPSIR